MYLEKWYYVYIMANRSKTLYTGVTGNIRQRVDEHKTGTFKGSFTSRYKLDRLVYFEKFKRVGVAIAREKQLKRWRKVKKIQLIVSMNPTRKDLAEDSLSRTQRAEEKDKCIDPSTRPHSLRIARAPLRMTPRKMLPPWVLSDLSCHSRSPVPAEPRGEPFIRGQSFL